MAKLDTAALQGAFESILERHLEAREYDPDLVGGWSKNVRSQVIDEIKSHQPGNVKIVVHLTILQVGTGMHVATSTLWDPDADLSVTATWESDKVYAHCTAFVIDRFVG